MRKIFVIIFFFSLFQISFAQKVKDTTNQNTDNVPSAFNYVPSTPEFRIGLGYSSLGGKGLSLSFLPVKFLKLKLTGYTSYEESHPGSIDVVNSYGAALNVMIYRVKFVNFYMLVGFNNSEERNSYINNNNYQTYKIINVTGGIGIGADFIFWNRLCFNLETGYHLVRRFNDRRYDNNYYYYPMESFNSPFENSILGMGFGIYLIL